MQCYLVYKGGTRQKMSTPRVHNIFECNRPTGGSCLALCVRYFPHGCILARSTIGQQSSAFYTVQAHAVIVQQPIICSAQQYPPTERFRAAAESFNSDEHCQAPSWRFWHRPLSRLTVPAVYSQTGVRHQSWRTVRTTDVSEQPPRFVLTT